MELLHTAHVPGGDGPFPTVVAIHGWGANGHDLLGLSPFLNGGEALVLCPEGPVEVPVGPGTVGYGWFPITGGGPMDPAEFEKGAALLRGFLDQALERYPIDPRKLLLLGFSQGGVMAYDLFLRDPRRFVGLAALSSWLPAELVQAAGAVEGLERSPVLVMHGTKDPMIPVERAQETRDRLLQLRVDLTYREFEMGHEIRPEALRELVGWMDQKAFHLIQLA